MSQLHKADVCVNHAMSTRVAQFIPSNTSGARDEPTLGPSTIYTLFLAFIEPPTNDSFESFLVSNVPGHKCSISSFTKGGKRYVWYNNPWGYGADVYGTKHSLDEEMEWEHGNLHLETRHGYVNPDIKHIRENLPASLKDKLGEPLKLKLQGRRLHYILERMKEKGGIDEKKAKDILARYEKWVFPNGDKHARHQHYPGRTEPPLPDYHAMAILQLLKLMTDSKHLVVVHPFDSMALRGPQEQDGIDEQTQKVCGEGGGACVLWSELYRRRARRETAELFQKRIFEADLLYIIKNKLTSDHYEGEKGAREYLAKNMQEIGGQENWKTILSAVYDMIPELGDAINPDAGTRYSARVRTKVSESSRFGTTWHADALWKLDQIEDFLADKVDHLYSEVKNPFLFTVTPFPEFVAGFIEGIYVVASPEARAHVAYVETVGKIATFVVKNNMHTFSGVKFFVAMLKMLISCKHDESVKHNDEIERREYPIPIGTRADRESGKRLVRKHAEEYGYGATNGSEYKEDTRKRKRW